MASAPQKVTRQGLRRLTDDSCQTLCAEPIFRDYLLSVDRQLWLPD